MPETKLVNGEIVDLTPGAEAEKVAKETASLAAMTDPNNFPLKRYQLHAVIAINGLTSAVDAAVSAIPDVNAREVARAKLAHADTYFRSDALFAVLGPAVGLTDAQIDAMWLQAKDL